MSRWEFMRQLEELLSDISPNEREEALQYYNDYFNDAGRENEQEVIKALGSPGQVARIVRDGLGENANQGEFTENGFKSGSTQPQNIIIKRTVEDNRQTESGQQAGNAGSSYAGNASASEEQQAAGSGSEEGMPAWAIVLIVIGCIFLSPVIFGLAISGLAVIASLFIGVFAVVLGIGIAMVVLFIVALALVTAGFGTMIPHPIAGMGLIGGGCICAALGILFMLVLVFLLGKCIPGICQGIAYIFKKIFDRKGGETA